MSRFRRFIKTFFISSIIIIVLLLLMMGVDEFFDDGEYRLFLALFLGFMAAVISLMFPTKKEREEKARRIQEEQEKAAEQKRLKEEEEKRKKDEEAAREAARNAPGCYSMDNVDLLTFGSRNNLLTAGNNDVRFKIRNRNPYDVLVGVRLKYADGWESYVHTYEVGGNKIRTVETLGRAWRKATDITIAYVR